MLQEKNMQMMDTKDNDGAEAEDEDENETKVDNIAECPDDLPRATHSYKNNTKCQWRRSNKVDSN